MKLAITGQPKSGKTTLAHILECEFGRQVILAEDPIEMMKIAHFPNAKSVHGKKSHQKAHYYLQIELEDILEEKSVDKLMICDHGTIDCLAGWPGSPESFFYEVGSSLEKELARYDWVIQIIGPQSPLSSDSAADILKPDPQEYWRHHPHLLTIPIELGFSAKVALSANLVRKILAKKTYEEILTGMPKKEGLSFHYESI